LISYYLFFDFLYVLCIEYIPEAIATSDAINVSQGCIAVSVTTAKNALTIDKTRLLGSVV